MIDDPGPSSEVTGIITEFMSEVLLFMLPFMCSSHYMFEKFGDKQSPVISDVLHDKQWPVYFDILESDRGPIRIHLDP